MHRYFRAARVLLTLEDTGGSLRNAHRAPPTPARHCRAGNTWSSRCERDGTIRDREREREKAPLIEATIDDVLALCARSPGYYETLESPVAHFTGKGGENPENARLTSARYHF